MTRARKDSDHWFGQQWNDFWFMPTGGENLVRARVLICATAVLWCLVMFSGSRWWFGEAGWNASDLARRLSVATEGGWLSRFRFSPLWSTSERLVFQAWAITGALLALTAAIGIGGRATMSALFLTVLFFAQRMTWATGAFEPVLVASLGYLIIDPGRALAMAGGLPQPRRWTATLATRLLQTHGWMIIVAALVSQLANVTWWRGDAVWWLAATGHSKVLSTEMLGGHILIVNALTHGISLCTLGAALALWFERLRLFGLICGCLLGAAYALISDQVLYGMIVVALLVGAFGRWDTRPAEVVSNMDKK